MKILFSILIFFLPLFLWSDPFNGWNEIKTEHFKFIFENSEENTAQELASYSEEIYEMVTGFFQSKPRFINVYINGRIDTPNGFFYPLPGSINLYPVYPLSSSNTTKSKSWLYELLLHEVVHYVSLESKVGIFGGLSYIFGKDVSASNGAFLPAWMIEGIAVYLETKYTKGGRGRNKYFKAMNKAAAVEEDFYSLYQLAYSSAFPPRNRIYSGGYGLIDFILGKYGEDIYSKIYNRYAKFPFLGPYHAIKKETGQSLKSIYNEYKENQINKYEDSKNIPKNYKREILSPNSYSNWTHPVKIESGILLYKTALKEKSSIIKYSELNKTYTKLFETELTDSSSFTSDLKGEKIVYAKGDSTIYHQFGFTFTSNLYIYENGVHRLLIEGESLFHPSLSKDGMQLIAVQREGSYSKLVRINMKTGEIDPLFQKKNTNIMNPSFSPSGEQIVFILNDHGYQDVYRFSMKEMIGEPLYTIDIDSEYYPRFIDENRVSFISDRDNDLSMYMYNIESDELSLIFKDEVALMDGFIVDDHVFYQSYQTKGYVFKKGLIETIIQEDINLSAFYSSGSLSLPNDIEKKEFIDWALPFLWLPKPGFNISESLGFQMGVGAMVFAGSIAQSGSWDFGFNVFPGLSQLDGGFNYLRKLGVSTLKYSFLQSYGEFYDGSYYFWRQKTLNALSWSLPFYEKSQKNWRDLLGLSLTLQHELQIDDLSSFAFDQSFKKANDNFLFAKVSLSYQGYNTNFPSISFFGDLSFYNQISFIVLLPLLSSNETVFTIKEKLNLSLPLGPVGFILKNSFEAAYANKPITSGVMNAKGWNSSESNSDISIHYSMDYKMPLALVDWGMPLGFNIQELAAALNLEGLSHFTLNGTVNHEIFAGLQFIATYGFNYGSIPIGFGVNFRIFNSSRPFDLSQDYKLYFFFSYSGS